MRSLIGVGIVSAALVFGCGRIEFVSMPADASSDVRDAGADSAPIADSGADADTAPPPIPDSSTDVPTVDTGEDATAVAWWNTAYADRVRLAIDNSGHPEAFSDFPLLVVLTPARFPYARAAADGSDLRFVDAAGALLAHEVEVWNPSGTSTIWVRIPRIEASASDGYVELYFGNRAADPARPTSDTWAAAHVLVLHLAGDARDSSSFANHGTLSGPRAITSPGGEGLAFSETRQDYGTIPASASLNGLDRPFTISAYARHRATQIQWRSVIGRETGVGGENDAWLGFFDDRYRGIITTSSAGGASTEIRGPTRPVDTWVHIALVWDGSRATYYADGGAVASTAASGTLSSSANPWYFGADANTGAMPDVDWLEGDIDEIRIEAVARGSAWLEAQADVFRDRLITYGAAERL